LGVVALLVFVIYKFMKRSFKISKLNLYKGKTVVITGASSGIGEEMAYQFAELGSNLVLAARRLDTLEGVVKKCQQFGVRAIAVKTDVAVESDCKTLVDNAVKTFGSIDVLVLNAGKGCLMRLDEAKDLKPYRDVMAINYWGYVYPTYYALEQLKQSNGTIIAVSSLSAKLATPRRSAYAASKAAVHGFFDRLRLEVPNVQITLVAPGFVLTELHDTAFTPGKKLEREKGNFMTVKECTKIIIDSAANKQQEVIMTFKGSLAAKLRPFFPSFIDSLTKRHAEKSVKKTE